MRAWEHFSRDGCQAGSPWLGRVLRPEWHRHVGALAGRIEGGGGGGGGRSDVGLTQSMLAQELLPPCRPLHGLRPGDKRLSVMSKHFGLWQLPGGGGHKRRIQGAQCQAASAARTLSTAATALRLSSSVPQPLYVSGPHTPLCTHLVCIMDKHLSATIRPHKCM